MFGTPDGDAFAAWLAVQSQRTLDACVRPACVDSIEVITSELPEREVPRSAVIQAAVDAWLKRLRAPTRRRSSR